MSPTLCTKEVGFGIRWKRTCSNAIRRLIPNKIFVAQLLWLSMKKWVKLSSVFRTMAYHIRYPLAPFTIGNSRPQANQFYLRNLIENLHHHLVTIYLLTINADFSKISFCVRPSTNTKYLQGGLPVRYESAHWHFLFKLKVRCKVILDGNGHFR